MSGSSWRLFAIAFPVIALFMVVMMRTAIFGSPIYEMGDLAANALQVDKAKRFDELVGNYSRFNFHHPGPAFFYVHALGEGVFYDLFRITTAPHNAHLFALTLLQAAFLAAGIVAVASIMPRGRTTFVLVACAIALIHFHLAGDPQSSIWPPDVLVFPFFAFVASSAVVATGRAGFLPLAVLAGAFLVHGHAGQPFFVVPIFLVAWVLLVRAVRRNSGPWVSASMRATRRPHLLAALVAVPFLATIVLDLLRGPDSNLFRILATRQTGAHPVDSVAIYLTSFMSYDVSAGVISVATGARSAFFAGHAPALAVVATLIALSIGLVWFRPATSDGSGQLVKDLRTFWVVLFLAAALSVAWVFVQPGDLYGFNSFFFWGLLFAAYLPAAVILTDRFAGGSRRFAVAFAAGLVVFVGMVQASPSIENDDTAGRELHASLPGVLATTDPTRPIYLDTDRLPRVLDAAGLALELERAGRRFEVADGGPSLIMGYDHVARSDSTTRPIRWTLVDPRKTAGYVVRLSEDLAIGEIDDS